MKLPALLSLALILSSCQAPSSGPGASRGFLRYSVKKSASAVGEKSPTHFVVEASLHGKGSEAQSHILVIYDSKWATLKVGESGSAGKDIEISDEGADPSAEELEHFSGTIIAAKCRESKDKRIETDLRVYLVKNGQITGKERFSEPLSDGESKDFPLKW